jgi:phosphatidylserine/phosphatidylglycerophosphate/cardiolipin synthase-like enzyme
MTGMGSYVSTYYSPADRAAGHVIGFIDFLSPGDRLDVMVYSITHDDIAEALIRAHQRGVVVRVLIDKVQASSSYADDEKLEAVGIAVRRDTQAGSMHHKVAIENGKVVGLGSFNWTKNADSRNAENWNIVRLKYVAERYQAEFDRLWDLNAPDPT